MLTLELSELALELKDGVLKNVGPSKKSATAKLFGVERATAREFGDKRVKFVFEDDEGNEVQVALFPDAVGDLQDDLEDLADGPVFE